MDAGPGRPRGGRKLTAEFLAPAVARAETYSEVCRLVGVRASGSTLTSVVRACREHGLDTSHFAHRCVAGGRSTKLPAEAILVDSRVPRRDRGSRVRRAMLEGGVPFACAVCGNEGSWNGAPLPLDVDHRNGDRRDNRPENVRFLCPNCHRQTATWGRRARVS